MAGALGLEGKKSVIFQFISHWAIVENLGVLITNVGPKKLVIGVDQDQKDDAEEPLVVVLKGTGPA